MIDQLEYNSEQRSFGKTDKFAHDEKMGKKYRVSNRMQKIYNKQRLKGLSHEEAIDQNQDRYYRNGAMGTYVLGTGYIANRRLYKTGKSAVQDKLKANWDKVVKS